MADNLCRCIRCGCFFKRENNRSSTIGCPTCLKEVSEDKPFVKKKYIIEDRSEILDFDD